LQHGADFIVSPLFSEDIARLCNKHKVLWIPGCGSLTEINRAEEMGAELVKLFPGNVFGPDFIKAVLGPSPKSRIMPTGGVKLDQSNIKSWLDAGASCLGIGSELITKDVLDNGEFNKLTENTKILVEFIRNYNK
jgi:2-dehydro-3-deoxyphosphogluconate aldolase/(4S)-4-hydroxy-2-oxoglutarate aldolase